MTFKSSETVKGKLYSGKWKKIPLKLYWSEEDNKYTVFLAREKDQNLSILIKPNDKITISANKNIGNSKMKITCLEFMPLLTEAKLLRGEMIPFSIKPWRFVNI